MALILITLVYSAVLHRLENLCHLGLFAIHNSDLNSIILFTRLKQYWNLCSLGWDSLTRYFYLDHSDIVFWKALYSCFNCHTTLIWFNDAQYSHCRDLILTTLIWIDPITANVSISTRSLYKLQNISVELTKDLKESWVQIGLLLVCRIALFATIWSLWGRCELILFRSRSNHFNSDRASFCLQWFDLSFKADLQRELIRLKQLFRSQSNH